MRQETNKEMDLLLRRLGRRQDTPVSTDHLDADKLSLYAENVLPPAARARYTEHLAECARCREIVVQLSSSAGFVAAQEPARVSETSALSKFLASLFSPMVLRYAVPALGLVVVAAIGFTVLRQQSATNSPIAQVTQQERAQAPVPASQPEPSSPSGYVSPGEEKGASANQRTAQRSDTENAAAPPATASAITEADKNAAAKKCEQPYQNETPAAPKPAVATADLQKQLETEEQKQKTADRVTVANEPPPAKAPEESKKEAVRTASVAGVARARELRRSEGAAAAAPQSAGQPVARDDAAEKDKNDADVRTVAGRRFRKQGNVWIDTAYDSSRSTTNLRRGSEQYRGLVADEPGIKSIADELDGEIIVVWKGRTYRIR